MDYCYEAEFALEGVKISKAFTQSGFSLIPSPSSENASILKYSFCMKALSEKEAEDKAKKDVKNFLILALLGTYSGEGASGFSARFVKIACTNYYELIKARMAPPLFGQLRISRFYNYSDATIAKVVETLNKYSTSINSTMWASFSFWFNGLSVEDEYDRFDRIWKSFEISYREVTKEKNVTIEGVRLWMQKKLSQTLMTDICNSYLKPKNSELVLSVAIQRCKSAFDCLIKQNFKSDSGKSNYSMDLSKALNNGTWDEALVNATICIAKLRNKVFHANIFSDDERSLVFISSSLVADVMFWSFHYMINQLNQNSQSQ